MKRRYSLRVSTAEDVARVDALLQASYPALMSCAYEQTVLGPALQLVTKANLSLLESGTYYVAEAQSGLIVGCGGWTAERPGTNIKEAGLGHLRHFGTHPEWTRRGVGRAIFDLCRQTAVAQGIETFECYSSLNAEPFYSALGFKAVRRTDIPLSPSVMLGGVIMRRAL